MMEKASNILFSPGVSMARSVRVRDKARPKTETGKLVKPAPRPRRELWICVVLFLATLAVYFQVRSHEFISYDDQEYVTDNAHVRAGLTWEGLAWAFTTSHTGNWLPLTWISHMLDCQLFGVKSGALHLSNVLLHALTALLLFAVLRRMTGAVWRSAFVAFLFSLHPLHVESVAWIAERKDVLSALLWFLTIWAYLGYVKRPGKGRYWLVVAVFSLGLMAKSMLVTLPLVLLLLDVWPLRRITLGAQPLSDGRGSVTTHRAATVWERLACLFHNQTLGRIVLEKVPLLALSLGVSALTYIVQQRSHNVMPLGLIPLWQRLGNALVSCVAYVADMLWPAKLAVFYPFRFDVPWWQPTAAGLAILAVSILALRSIRRRPYLAVGWFWYLVTLTPVIGLVQVGSQARADRYAYIPMVGLSIALAWGAADLVKRRPRLRTAMAAAAVAVCLACAALTWRQLRYWRDTVTLFQHSVSVTSGNFIGYNILGLALRNQGRLDEAIASYREAIKFDPGFEDAHKNLSQALLEQGRTGEILPETAIAAQIKPDDEEAQYNLGTTLAEQGRFEEAVEAFRAAVRLKPDYAKAHANLGAALASLGRLSEAIAEFTEALRIDPGLEGVREELDAALESQQQSAGKGR
jgi:tetratricopeptide (TPR) repeat protein